jgi:Uma2 family endonuclease
MSVVTPTMPAMFGIPPGPIRKFTVDEYHQLIRIGVLTEDDPVELLEGWIIQKMPRNPPHDGTLAVTNKRLGNRLPAGWHPRVQMAVTLPDSEPEPDLAIVRGQEEDYFTRHPGPSDIALLVEVADSSLNRDRTEKGRIYARAGIPVYWIINLTDAQVEVYSDPTGPDAAPRYRQRQDFDRNADVSLVIDGAVIATVPVRELLP